MTGRVVILGGGITGLAMARMLEPYFDDIVIVEQNSKLGGLCMSEYFDGVAIDICSSHIFNTKDDEVRDFVFSIMPKCEWVKSERNAKIFIEDKFIGFPFENHMFQLGKDFAHTCINEIKCSATLRMPQSITGNSNLKTYLLNTFGQTAYNKYYLPYSEKTWQYPLDKININWVHKDKMPIPDINNIEQANQGVGAKDEGMTHSSFYYPKHGGIESFLEALFPATANILTGCKLEHLIYDTAERAWQLTLDGYDGEMIKLHADFVINTTPVSVFLKTMGVNCPLLPFHGTDILVCISDFFMQNKEVSWTYFPEQKYWWSRAINVPYLQGKSGKRAHVVVEAPYGATLKRDKIYLPGYNFVTIATYQHAMTYPIEPVKHIADIDKLHIMLQNLRESCIFSIGRWGKHKYSNIDVVIRDALNAKKEIIERL